MQRKDFYRKLIDILKNVATDRAIDSKSNPELMMMRFVETIEKIHVSELRHVILCHSVEEGKALAVAVFILCHKHGYRRYMDLLKLKEKSELSAKSDIIDMNWWNYYFISFTPDLEEDFYCLDTDTQEELVSKYNLDPKKLKATGKRTKHHVWWSYTYSIEELNVWTIYRAIKELELKISDSVKD